MVKVKLLIARATATGAENRGDVVSVSTNEAERMIAAGQAVPVTTQKREKAVKSKRETR